MSSIIPRTTTAFKRAEANVWKGKKMSYAPRMSRLTLQLLFCVLLTPSALGQISVEADGLRGTCTPLVTRLQTRWQDVRRYMVPVGEEVRNPKDEHFVCVSRSALRDATEKRIVSGANVRCFSPPFSRGLGVCCDNALSYCTQLNPGLFPDRQKRPGEDKPYEPPKSNWVRPPGDREQWQSN